MDSAERLRQQLGGGQAALCSVMGNMLIAPADASALYLYCRNACWTSVCMHPQKRNQCRVEEFCLESLRVHDNATANGRLEPDVCVPAAQMAETLALATSLSASAVSVEVAKAIPCFCTHRKIGVNAGMSNQMLLLHFGHGAGAVTCLLVAEEGFLGILAILDLKSLAKLLLSCKDITGTIL